MRDYLDDTTFTRRQLEALPVVVAKQVLVEHAGPDGKPLVVDVVEAPGFWIQFSRAHGVYRCAERKHGQVTPYPPNWRTAG